MPLLDHTPESASPVSVSQAGLIRLSGPARAIALDVLRVNSLQTGAYVSHFRGRGMEFDESRPYQPGDDPRSIDWRVTARTGRAHTKVFQEERERPVLVVLDAGPTLYFGTRRRLKSVAAGQMAAAIAWAAVRRGDRIGGFFFAPGKHRELRPAGGRRGAMRLIQGLVDWLQPERHPTGEPEKLSSALERVRHTVRPGSLVIIVSDFFGLDAQCNRHLSRLRQHSDVVGLQITDPIEINTPPPGRYGVSDGVQAGVLDTGSGEGRRHYREFFQARQQRLQRLTGQRGIPLVQLSTTDNVTEALQARFGGRRRLPAVSGASA